MKSNITVLSRISRRRSRVCVPLNFFPSLSRSFENTTIHSHEMQKRSNNFVLPITRCWKNREIARRPRLLLSLPLLRFCASLAREFRAREREIITYTRTTRRSRSAVASPHSPPRLILIVRPRGERRERDGEFVYIHVYRQALLADAKEDARREGASVKRSGLTDWLRTKGLKNVADPN